MEMAERVTGAIAAGHRHLVIQAGTGTGKTLASPCSAIESGSTVVVATATKALQDQLALKDLPFLAEHLGVDFDFAVLKGRSNYVCLQRLREMSSPDQAQLELDTMALTTQVEIKRIAEWVATTDTGDQAEMEWDAHRQRLAGGERRQRRMSRRRPLPPRRSVLHRTGPVALLGARRGRREHASLRTRCRALAAQSCPSMTLLCSTRPTCSKT